MKKYIINKVMNYIKKYTNYSKQQIVEIEYGLVSIYLTFSKLIIISIIALILGMFKDMLIFMIFFNIIRLPAFGLHATKSWICLLSSTLIFISLPIICLNINISIYIKLIIGIFCIIFMYKNAPADTKKKPIVNKKRRFILKMVSTAFSIIFVILSIIIKNNYISNCMIFALILENCLISPLTYKIFRLPYNNYIDFLKSHPDFTN